MAGRVIEVRGKTAWAARIVFYDLRGTEVLWVGVCAPHGWNLTEISVRVKHSQVKAM
jgi:hypothetical protein